jgi:probable phosphoglycerate mutase
VGGYLAGRSPNVFLGAAGRAQAQRLGDRMRREKFDAIFSSPRERTRETAQAVSIACEVGPVNTRSELDEIDFGSWSGKTFVELDGDPRWHRWNRSRGAAVTPTGESMEDARRRICGCMEELCQEFAGRTVVLVSHADVIKCAICDVLSLPVESCFRFDIDPASISTVVKGDWGAKLLRLNETV